jgi:dipeptidyl aminopeptidase/acylaminoacyl peptidase
MKRPFSDAMLLFSTVSMLVLFGAGFTARTQEAKAAVADTAAKVEGPVIHVDRWLLLGPVGVPPPAFQSEGVEKLGASKLLGYEETALGAIKPAEGDGLPCLLDRTVTWKKAAADTGGVSMTPAAGGPSIAYCAVYVDAPRWMKTGITARSTDPFSVSVDGVQVMKIERPTGFAHPQSGEAKLERGKHLLLVKSVHLGAGSEWRLDVSISPRGVAEAPTLSLSPTHDIGLDEILYIQQITNVSVSPDGKLVAISTGRFSREDDKYQSWVEIRDARDGRLIRAMKDCEKMSNVRWAPSGNRLSYVVTTNADKGAIHVLDLDTGGLSTIVENVKNLGGYLWSRDGGSIVYTVTEKAEPDKRGLKHLTNIEDRWRTGGDRSYLYISTVPGGMTRRLTAGPHSTEINDVHPDGKRALVTRRYEDLSSRPYETTELAVVNLDDGSVETLWKGPWLQNASYSPDGSKILIQAGPSSFGDIGTNVPAGTIPNDYDGQLYLFDPVTKGVEPLTRDFDSAVSGATWSTTDGNIYVVAENGARVSLFKYSVMRKTFERIDAGAEAVGDWDIARDKLACAYVGSGATAPPRLYSIDLAHGRPRMIFDPNADDFTRAEEGSVNDWGFTSSSGRTIEGYYYLPPRFDPKNKYPCIVYYYGGTSPTSRIFGGRYPKNLWAAEGYVVYVLQPSGATGYGQAFSAFHVNDWGKIVSDEIIEGVTKFADAHPFVERDRIGCIGASYGGFMTELLLTKTDIFAAAVSHAGISSIASYWGEGYWGYSYNAVSAAGSFPWNRRDIYVDQSPLFNANRIVTPLLLIHGSDDTNVPPGESDQMFTALKLLGKKVEYIRVEGQNHAIMDYKKRDLWSKTIMAWFDRYLKGEPEWWNDLYPSAPGERETAADTGSAATESDSLVEGSGPATVGAVEKPDTSAGAGESATGHAVVPEPANIGVRVLHKVDGSTVLVGEVTREDIIKNIAGWDDEYFSYTPDEATVGDIAGRLEGVRLVVVLGTWCSDSHREVPRLWKVLEQVGFPPENMRTFAVERAKAAPDSALTTELIDWSKNVRDYYGIKAVESIIVYRDGVELGRIVEAPATSIEADLLEILER